MLANGQHRLVHTAVQPGQHWTASRNARQAGLDLTRLKCDCALHSHAMQGHFFNAKHQLNYIYIDIAPALVRTHKCVHTSAYTVNTPFRFCTIFVGLTTPPLKVLSV